MAAKLLPIQDTKIPTKGPKMAPLRITIGSEGIGVAESRPMIAILIRGARNPVESMILSNPLMSFAKYTIKKMGTMKVTMTKRVLKIFLKEFIVVF